MKSLLFLSLFSASVQSACPVFSQDQVKVLQDSYTFGQPYGNGHVLATLALQESSAGLFIVNTRTSDFGIYQGNVKTICAQANVELHSLSCGYEVAKVILEPEYAAKHALKTLDWWSKYYRKRKTKNAYEMTIRSYNTGFSPNSQNGDIFWDNYKKNSRMVKQCIQLKVTDV